LHVRTLSSGTIVISRRRRLPKTGGEILVESCRYDEPDMLEKPNNPLVFQKTSYAQALRAQNLWPKTLLTSGHIHQLFGPPTRVCFDHVEWVLKIKKEVVKVVADQKGVSVWGFCKTPTLERWVNRLLAS